MSLKPFNKDLLNFLYFLVRNQEYMNSVQISKKFTLNGEKITDRTIRRWFRYLQKTHKLDYFPYINYENIGLCYISVVLYGLKNEALLKINPYNNYIFTAFDTKRMKRCMLVNYCLPYERLGEFKSFWKNAKKRKLIENCEFIHMKKPVAYYSPFHEVLDKDGKLKLNSQINNSYFTGLLKQNLKQKYKVDINKEVLKNPFIIPVMFEYFREYRSSRNVWYSLKTSFGEDIWEYIKERKRRKTDGSGIKFVQSTMKDLHGKFHEFFQQIRITYKPFYESDNFIAYTFVRLKNNTDLAALSEEISEHTLSTIVYPIIRNHYTVCFYTLTDINEFVKILDILNRHTKNNHSKILLMDYADSWRYWSDRSFLKIDASCFDPEKLRWKYDNKKYLKMMKKL